MGVGGWGGLNDICDLRRRLRVVGRRVSSRCDKGGIRLKQLKIRASRFFLKVRFIDVAPPSFPAMARIMLGFG